MSKRHLALGLGLLLVTAASQSAFAAPVYWTPPSGSDSVLSYTDGQSDKGLFGTPVVSGGTFAFFPDNFQADAPKANGTSGQTTTDRLSFKATGANGTDLKTITISEVGDYSILGAGGQVKVTGLLVLTNLTGPTVKSIGNYTPTIVYSNTGNGQPGSTAPKGDSDGVFTVDYTLTLPAGIKSIQLVLNNNVQAVALAGSTSTIQKKGVTITINDPGVPEPATAGVLVLGGLLLGRRRTPTA